MKLLLYTVALALPSMLRLGHLRLPIFGIFAAMGLIAALLLSQRVARLAVFQDAGLDPARLWDAAIFGITAAFVISRLLLVVRDPRAFLRYPLLVLALPSLTYLGIALSAAAVLVYLQRKHLPILRTLDAWAPCAALFAAYLALGHFVEGTDAGMPTRLPWGIVMPGEGTLGRVHPVQLYTMLGSLALCAVLLRGLALRPPPGALAGLALAAGGLLSLLLATLTQPAEILSTAWLEPVQWIAAGSIALGTILLLRPMPAPRQAIEEPR